MFFETSEMLCGSKQITTIRAIYNKLWLLYKHFVKHGGYDF